MKLQRRRSFLRLGSASIFGVALAVRADKARSNEQNAESVSPPKAQSMILIWLDGGPSTIDMWDMKVDAPDRVRGAFKSISTKIPGFGICEHLPKMAQIVDQCAVIRSLHHNVPEHVPGSQWMLTGHAPVSAMEYPSLGSIVTKSLPATNAFPPYVAFNKPAAATPGYLGSAWNAFELNDAVDKLPVGLSLGTEIDRDRFEKRLALRELFDRGFDRFEHDVSAVSLDRFHTAGVEILRADSIRRALDISTETAKIQEAYGSRSPFGRNALRARRLVQAGARFVTVGLSGWDTHTDNFSQLKNQLLPPLDAGLATLISDLKDRGLLETTVVCCCGEFGRTPVVNAGAGRDHWSRVFSAVLAGGGLTRAAVFGASDQDGQAPLSDACTPGDLCATLLHLLGIDSQQSLLTPSGRPMKIIEAGNVLTSIVA